MKLALKIENYFHIEEGTLMLLQLLHDIIIENRKTQKTPNLSLFRPILFWDTSMQKIDWEKNKKAIINRVYSRGNKQEQDEINHFYGEESVKNILKTFKWKLNA